MKLYRAAVPVPEEDAKPLWQVRFLAASQSRVGTSLDAVEDGDTCGGSAVST